MYKCSLILPTVQAINTFVHVNIKVSDMHQQNFATDVIFKISYESVRKTLGPQLGCESSDRRLRERSAQEKSSRRSVSDYVNKKL